jgi:hypothetical protein
MAPKDGFHITWSKAGVIFAAIATLQGMGFWVSHPRASEKGGVETRIAVMEEKIDGMSKTLDTIELCLLEKRCGASK